MNNVDAINAMTSPQILPTPGLPELTVCMVAHNEAANIARALVSVSGWAGRIVVLDCESTDATAQIARSFSADVVPHANILPEITKNDSFALATTEWILSLDADEVIPDALKKEVEAMLRSNPLASGFKVPRRNFYFGTPLMHGGNYPDYQLRLFRTGRGKYPGIGIHERIVIDGDVGVLHEPFDHHPYPDFESWAKKFDFYTRSEAERLRTIDAPCHGQYVRRAMIYRPFRRWFERLFIRRGLRDGVAGILAATFDLMTIVVGFGRYWMTTEQRKRDAGGYNDD